MRAPSVREWILVACVAALALAALGTERGGDAPSAIAEARPAERAAQGAGRAAAANALDLARLRRQTRATEPANLFASKSWYVPPPPPPPPPPAKVVVAPPAAPPLPYRYLGRYVDNGAPVFFLLKGDRILTVKIGDIVEGNYRVDGIVGSRLGLTYLPLNIQQSLDIGSA